jgi:hypothetical protein
LSDEIVVGTKMFVVRLVAGPGDWPLSSG